MALYSGVAQVEELPPWGKCFAEVVPQLYGFMVIGL